MELYKFDINTNDWSADHLNIVKSRNTKLERNKILILASIFPFSN